MVPWEEIDDGRAGNLAENLAFMVEPFRDNCGNKKKSHVVDLDHPGNIRGGKLKIIPPNCASLTVANFIETSSEIALPKDSVAFQSHRKRAPKNKTRAEETVLDWID